MKSSRCRFCISLLPLFFHYQFSRSVDTSVIAQLCQNNGSLLTSGKCVSTEIFLHRLNQGLSGFGHSSAQYNYIRIHHTGEDCQRIAQVGNLSTILAATKSPALYASKTDFALISSVLREEGS